MRFSCRYLPGFAFPPDSHGDEIFHYVVKGRFTAVAGDIQPSG
jgi:hypothetical protein